MRVMLVAMALVLAACGGVAGDQPAAGGGSPGSSAMCAEGATECNDTPVSGDPCPPEGCSDDGSSGAAPDEPEGRLVRPAGRDGLANVMPIGWDRTSGRRRTLTVHWWSGVEPCHVLAEVDVVERRRKVVITLYEGSADPDAACIEIAEALRTRVRLERPLGDRTVVDGAQR